MSADDTSSLHARLDRQDKMLDEIKHALVGNPAMGHNGLVARMDAVERQVEGHGRKLLLATGAMTGLTIAFDWVKWHMGGGK